MKWACKLYTRTTDFPRSLGRIFQMLSSPSPVCSYVPPTNEIYELLLKLVDHNITSDSEVMRDLQMKLPFFHDLLSELRIESSLPDVWTGLLLHLFDCSMNPFETAEHIKEPPLQEGESKYSWYVK